MTRTFLFDIDHTLYPYTHEAETHLTQLIDAYLIEEMGMELQAAQKKRDDYYHLFGTTLAGLLYFDEIDAARYLEYKNRFDVGVLERQEPALQAVRDSDARKLAITNSHQRHGERVLEHLGLSEAFEKIYAIEQMGFWGKPFRKSYDAVFSDAHIEPENTVFFEDSMRNLAYPKALGMTTILINQHSVAQGDAEPYVDYHVSNLKEAMEIADAIE